ncbi:MAG TPA: hypothetical protein VFW33_14935 [Gemmataceae bacterium]|nr:hypothetical protein [Gemmataceae bacterium]
MNEAPVGKPRYPLLEGVTAVLLILVLLSLGWMALGAWQPGWTDWVPQAAQVGAAVILLAAALGMVSLVALLHTRDSSPG